MAKVKKLVKEQSLSKEDFEKLKEYIETVNGIKQKIAEAELVKSANIGKYSQVDGNFKQFTAGLEHKYGEGISIEVSTGTYKTAKEMEAEKVTDGSNKEN
jgi:hypothetical protein